MTDHEMTSDVLLEQRSTGCDVPSKLGGWEGVRQVEAEYSVHAPSGAAGNHLAQYSAFLFLLTAHPHHLNFSSEYSTRYLPSHLDFTPVPSHLQPFRESQYSVTR